VRLLPTKTTFEPYEPIIINLEITNNAPMPLTIDRGGPIHPQVALVTSVQMSREFALPEIRPMIIDIDRRLRIEPREHLVVPVDMRSGGLGQILNARPLRGAIFTVKAIINFRITGQIDIDEEKNNVIEPGVLGSEVETPSIRVDGIRLTRGWIAGAMESILEPGSAQDLTTIAVLSHVVPLMQQVRAEDPLRALDQFGDRELEEDAATAIAEAYAKVDAPSRAWLLAVMPRLSPTLIPVYTMAQTDENKHVRLMYLLYCLTSPDDPMIDAARRGSDPDIRALAEVMHSILLARAAP
jgi:hypothetical protein